MNHLKMTVAGLGMLMLTACNGILMIYMMSRKRLCRLRDRL